MSGKIGSRTEDLDSCALCVKYLLIALNFFFFAAGCVMLGVSLWLYLERDFVSPMLGNNLMTVSIVMLISFSSLIMIFTFMGCCGAISEKRPLLLIYFFMLLIIFLGMLIGGIIAVIHRSEIGEEIRGRMRSTLQNDYGVKLDDSYNRWITDSWDRSQEFLRCCAVESQSWNTYRTSEWYKQQPGNVESNKPFVPPSCCERNQDGEYHNKDKCQTFKLGPPSRQAGEDNEALHYRGCYPASKDFVKEHTGYIIGLGVGIGLSIIIGMVFSLMLYIQIARFHSVD